MLLLDHTPEAKFEALFPYYHRVPRRVADNIRFRQNCFNAKSKEDRKELKKMCRADPLFYINTFVWIFQAKPEPGPVPFITFDNQNATIHTICDVLGKESLLMDKTREQGGSYMVICVLEQRWHFFPYQNFLLASRKEDYVDKPDNLDSLFAKVDFIHKHQPKWLLPADRALGDDDPNRTHMHLFNPEQDSTFDGETTNAGLSAGGRRLAVFLDEFALVGTVDTDIMRSTVGTTDCRYILSTPRGSDNEFARLRTSSIKKVHLHWQFNPLHNGGMYTDSSGKLRSPWYDFKCKELGNNASAIASELDMDYSGSGGAYYPSELLRRLRSEHVREPVLVCEPDVVDKPLPNISKLLKQPSGRLSLWMHLGSNGQPVAAPYGLAVDVGTPTRTGSGPGASNSVISAVNLRTGEKVLEFADSNIAAHKLARLTAALANWLRDEHDRPAEVIYDTNGPGNNFAEPLRTDYKFRRIYMDDKGRPGFHKTGGENGNAITLFGDHRKMLMEDLYIERSANAVAEMEDYRCKEDGSAVHAPSQKMEDPSGAKANHGDRVIASCLLVHLLGKRRGERPKPPEHDPPYLSVAYWQREIQRKRAEASLV